MMKIKLRIVENGKEIKIESAVREGIVMLKEKEIITTRNVKLQISTSLLDDFDEEIFEGDFLCDPKGQKYYVTYQNGAFFAIKKTAERSNSKMQIPLFLLQKNGRIPARIVR